MTVRQYNNIFRGLSDRLKKIGRGCQDFCLELAQPRRQTPEGCHISNFPVTASRLILSYEPFCDRTSLLKRASISTSSNSDNRRAASRRSNSNSLAKQHLDEAATAELSERSSNR